MILYGVLQSSQDNPKHHVYLVLHHILPPLPFKYITSHPLCQGAPNPLRITRGHAATSQVSSPRVPPAASQTAPWPSGWRWRARELVLKALTYQPQLVASVLSLRKKKVGRKCGIELYIIVNNYNRCIPSGKNKVKKKMGLTQIGDTTQQFQWILRDYSTHDRCDTPIWFIWVWIYNDN